MNDKPKEFTITPEGAMAACKEIKTELIELTESVGSLTDGMYESGHNDCLENINSIIDKHAKDHIDRPKIVCLCGSTRFMEQFFEVGWKFTLENWIVLSVGVCKHAEHHGAEALGLDVADRLDELHLHKIDLADLIYILNVDGYIGKSTRKEIDYAEKIGKTIEYLE